MDSDPPEEQDPERPPAGAPPDAGDRLVTVARCSTTAPADFARSVLAQAGIEAVLQGQYLNQVFPFLAGALGGILVQVRLRDAAISPSNTAMTQKARNGIRQREDRFRQTIPAGVINAGFRLHTGTTQGAPRGRTSQHRTRQ